MGTRGTMAISNLSNALLSMNKSSMNVNTTLSKIANTFSNTVRWGITASIFQEMMSSVQGAVSYMKNLDEWDKKYCRFSESSNTAITAILGRGNKSPKC